MHALHEYLCQLIEEKLLRHSVVVFYDPNRDFDPFIDELEIVGKGRGALPRVVVRDTLTHLIRYDGSFFDVKFKAEPIACLDKLESLLIHIPGVTRDRTSSVLMELEKGGICYEPKLKQLARKVLKKNYTDGVIDEMIAPDKLSWSDIVGYIKQSTTGEPASILRVVFGDKRDNASLVAAWIADPTTDPPIEEKQGKAELYKLIGARLGFEVHAEDSLKKVRNRCLRYVLISEFRADLHCAPPSSITVVPAPSSAEKLSNSRAVAEALRCENPDVYPKLADELEKEFRLAREKIDPTALGCIDTFRFEERSLLSFAGELIVKGDYTKALGLVEERKRSFWVDRDVLRQSQWMACRLMAELGTRIEETREQMRKEGASAQAWIDAYTTEDGWHRVDLAQRNLEAWVAKMDEEPEVEQALERVRNAYEELIQSMATTFTDLYSKSDWSISETLHQTCIYPEIVNRNGESVAYFMVDAMRYEMGVELREQLKDAQDVVLHPAIAALPTITPVGMAALLPGASATFDVIEHKGKLGSRIADVPLKDLQSRMKFLKSRVPNMVEMELGRLLQLTTKKLQSAIKDASLIVVRSREIDALGEIGDNLLARQLMDTTVGNVARAVRKLASLRIERFVISADHGHQFTREKEEAFRTDNPAGEKIELHRRCWIGRGGKTPAGAIRVKAAELGYDSDLDFVFPVGSGVFHAGGGLAYHHGGISLQELVIPVLSLRIPSATQSVRPTVGVRLSGVPETLTNRTFGISMELVGLFATEAMVVRPVLLSEGIQVGEAGMAIEAEFDTATHCVKLPAGKIASVALLLKQEDCKKLRVVIQDPATDAVLVQSDDIIVKLGI